MNNLLNFGGYRLLDQDLRIFGRIFFNIAREGTFYNLAHLSHLSGKANRIFMKIFTADVSLDKEFPIEFWTSFGSGCTLVSIPTFCKINQLLRYARKFRIHERYATPCQTSTELVVELLQLSAVDQLITYRQFEVRDFHTVITTDFEALYAYKIWLASTLFTVVYTRCAHADQWHSVDAGRPHNDLYCVGGTL